MDLLLISLVTNCRLFMFPKCLHLQWCQTRLRLIIIWSISRFKKDCFCLKVTQFLSSDCFQLDMNILECHHQKCTVGFPLGTGMNHLVFWFVCCSSFCQLLTLQYLARILSFWSLKNHDRRTTSLGKKHHPLGPAH